MAFATVGAVLVVPATWNTAEIPYMGRVRVLITLVALERGPWPLPVELGRPTFGCAEPSAFFSVPLSLQPVKGWLAFCDVSNPLVPDSFLSLTSSSQDPS